MSLAHAYWSPLVVLAALGCDAASHRTSADAPRARDAPVDAGADARVALFGRPSDRTGLAAAECRPSCGACADLWTARDWPSERVASLGAFELLEPPLELAADPYDAPVPPARTAVCAVERVDARRYRLRSFDTVAAARAAGAMVTHDGACGLCSTLHDLAVYAGIPDLGQPVRECGVAHQDLPGNVTCLEALGFSRPCAQIWAYNTRHTRARCLDVCAASFLDPYNAPDGTLNPCLACDERESGPVFKAIAGRTRRNTGIPNAICRPCSEVIRLEHEYAP